MKALRNEEIQWQREAPASEEALTALESGAPARLPAAYREFLRYSNGGEGILGIQPGWFQIWTAQEVLPLNADYQVQDWLPYLFGFGSSGGGELLAFDTRTPDEWSVCIVPFSDLCEASVLPLASNFTTFVQEMGHAEK